jgi:hypothetical protein
MLGGSEANPAEKRGKSRFAGAIRTGAKLGNLTENQPKAGVAQGGSELIHAAIAA